MAVALLIVAIAIVLILYIQAEKAYKFYLLRRRVNKIPGPNFPIPFVGIAYKLLTMRKEDRIDWYINTSDQYKDGCFRSWVGTTPVVHIRKPEYVETILRSNTEITKSTTYDYLRPWLGQGLLTSTGSQWHTDRKLITPAFNFNVRDQYAEVMLKKSAVLSKCIEREIKSRGDKPIEISALCLRYALDVICETAMGVDVRTQEEVENVYSSAVRAITTGAITRFFRPWLRSDWIFAKTALGKEFIAAVNRTNELCNRVIMEKQRTKNKTTDTRKKKAFLDLLLDANEKEGDPMSNDDLLHQTNTFMFAGHDTTSGAISWALFCLGNDLEIQKRVHDELDEVLGNADDQTILDRLPNLKYLDRVMKEVLRLYPSATVVSRRLVNDMQIGLYNVPKEATVAVHIYQLHRDPSVWPDPLRFDPDRFLPENIKGRHPYAYLPFSAGPRNCIGQKFARLESKLTLIQVLRKFTVKSVENHSTIKKYSDVTLRPCNGIYVYMTKRENN